MIRYGTKHRLALTSALVVLATVAGSPASAAVAQEVHGNARGGITLAYQTIEPVLLGRFFFGYDVVGDRHLQSMTVMPLSNDLLSLRFADNSTDNGYLYNVGHHRVPRTGIVTGSLSSTIPGCEVSCTCPGGTCSWVVVPPSPDHVFVIRGFSFRFTNTDHHLDRVAVLWNASFLRASFDDRNDDDDYTVNVSWAWVPRSLFSLIDVRAVGTAEDVAQLSVQAPLGSKVISGFSFDYEATDPQDDDHHVRVIGIAPRSNTIDLFYADKDPTDSSRWDYEVRYSVLR